MFNRANYGSFNTTLSATNAAQTAVVRAAGAESRQRVRATGRAARVQAVVLMRRRSLCVAHRSDCRLDRGSRRQVLRRRRRVHVRSTPANVVLGSFPGDRAPIARVPSGAVVRIDTLSQRGATQQEDPVTFLGKYGVKPDEILQDVKDLWAAGPPNRQNERGGGGHILTGPIYVEGAEPGDTLAVEMLELTTRVPYGINSTSSTGGVFSASYPSAPGEPIPGECRTRVISFAREWRTAARSRFFPTTIRVPMPRSWARWPSRPIIRRSESLASGSKVCRPPDLPGAYGGNMDFRELKAGSTLYLPVFHSGALFYAGDPHGVQGDGEVSGNAIEQSLTGVFRFTVLKGKTH